MAQAENVILVDHVGVVSMPQSGYDRAEG